MGINYPDDLGETTSRSLGTIEVADGDAWQIAKAPQNIETTGLGPCIGLIIYDPLSKEAIVGHYAEPRGHGDERKSLQGQLREAERRFLMKDRLMIYVGGGELTSFD